jgi:hypothetical protein
MIIVHTCVLVYVHIPNAVPSTTHGIQSGTKSGNSIIKNIDTGTSDTSSPNTSCTNRPRLDKQ